MVDYFILGLLGFLIALTATGLYWIYRKLHAVVNFHTAYLATTFATLIGRKKDLMRSNQEFQEKMRDGTAIN